MQPGVGFDNLNALDFYILKSEKTSRAKAHLELAPFIGMDEADEALEVVMVTWKE